MESLSSTCPKGHDLAITQGPFPRYDSNGKKLSGEKITCAYSKKPIDATKDRYLRC